MQALNSSAISALNTSSFDDDGRGQRLAPYRWTVNSGAYMSPCATTLEEARYIEGFDDKVRPLLGAEEFGNGTCCSGRRKGVAEVLSRVLNAHCAPTVLVPSGHRLMTVISSLE
mmetsp:Transcript_7335/g.26708  ORF Transcript_7335/g.26708 Transcript_7335/m.26708 type:complete len:114 (-) Transcript_7335:238-579(-)